MVSSVLKIKVFDRVKVTDVVCSHVEENWTVTSTHAVRMEPATYSSQEITLTWAPTMSGAPSLSNLTHSFAGRS